MTQFWLKFYCIFISKHVFFILYKAKCEKTNLGTIKKEYWKKYVSICFPEGITEDIAQKTIIYELEN